MGVLFRYAQGSECGLRGGAKQRFADGTEWNNKSLLEYLRLLQQSVWPFQQFVQRFQPFEQQFQFYAEQHTGAKPAAVPKPISSLIPCGENACIAGRGGADRWRSRSTTAQAKEA